MLLKYPYLFERNGNKYYVYSHSKDRAIAKYLEENNLKELPKGCIVTRLPI